jgi:two-component system NarL family response regulator
VVADDHRLFRQGLVALLRSEPLFDVVGEAENGDECMQQAMALKPDVVLMDVKMPKIGGVEATKRITEANPQTRVVVLTISEDDQDVLSAIQSGARAYIIKDTSASELFSVIQQVYAGNAVLSPSVTLRVIQTLHAENRLSLADKALTPREHEVYNLLAQGADNRQIAEKLSISENTVKTHVAHILDKLDLQSRNRVAAYERGTRSDR